MLFEIIEVTEPYWNLADETLYIYYLDFKELLRPATPEQCSKELHQELFSDGEV